jgi:hypothetical protein
MLMPGANWDCPGMTVASLGMGIQTRLSIGSGGLFNPAHAWIGLMVTRQAMNAHPLWKLGVRPLFGMAMFQSSLWRN